MVKADCFWGSANELRSPARHTKIRVTRGHKEMRKMVREKGWKVILCMSCIEFYSLFKKQKRLFSHWSLLAHLISLFHSIGLKAKDNGFQKNFVDFIQGSDAVWGGGDWYIPHVCCGRRCGKIHVPIRYEIMDAGNTDPFIHLSIQLCFYSSIICPSLHFSPYMYL